MGIAALDQYSIRCPQQNFLTKSKTQQLRFYVLIVYNHISHLQISQSQKFPPF